MEFFVLPSSYPDDLNLLVTAAQKLKISDWQSLQHYALCSLADVDCDLNNKPGVIGTLATNPGAALASRSFLKKMIRGPKAKMQRNLYFGSCAAIIEEAQGNEQARFPRGGLLPRNMFGLDELVLDGPHAALARAGFIGLMIDSQYNEIEKLKREHSKSKWVNTKGEILLRNFTGESTPGRTAPAPNKASQNKISDIYKELIDDFCKTEMSWGMFPEMLRISQRTMLEVIYVNIPDMPAELKETITKISEHAPQLTEAIKENTQTKPRFGLH